MNTRTPLRPENLKDLLGEVLDRLNEFTDEQLETLRIAVDQHSFDRDVKNGLYPYEEYYKQEDYYTELDENMMNSYNLNEDDII